MLCEARGQTSWGKGEGAGLDTVGVFRPLDGLWVGGAVEGWLESSDMGSGPLWVLRPAQSTERGGH